MAVSPEMNEVIERHIAEIKKEDYLRYGLSQNNFLDEFSGILARS